MKKAMLSATILASTLLAGTAFAKDVKDIVPEVVQAAANPAVVQAVKEQNAKGLTLAKIQETDKAWSSATEPDAFMKSFTTNAAAKALASTEKSKPYLIEFILTDNQGANVAVTALTSDYWQGDEPKFTNAFADGTGKPYIARPQKDKSSGEVISQVSVPVMAGDKAIGTLTVGVRVEKLK
ncbi:MAG: hypothetical protein B7Y56_06315 [Gallionellales bacterium 35-53-114]|jgi:hypothetical protein|nr:MAG: hypothetical protein B7Y56_06315 [Gallionellales bacterium 35-53-114]OYZ63810.1 MAG: hypothetical protein B7Y04_07415 [Gallionellales bacterium 24-53-125]OZB09358.1 MAG: hypothetical protein B7X61_06795 [Gallionellales bacterium 39-52-133]HQS57986.1 PDC sensor domain-containing protein [Gallionellaceae bacterium]HQS76147.1 PDC sensor domain-containing protein [Gallionellaceae bacterium]